MRAFTANVQLGAKVAHDERCQVGAIGDEAIDTETKKLTHCRLVVDGPGVNEDASTVTHLNEPWGEDRHTEDASRQLHRVNGTQGRRSESNETKSSAQDNEQ